MFPDAALQDMKFSSAKCLLENIFLVEDIRIVFLTVIQAVCQGAVLDA